MYTGTSSIFSIGLRFYYWDYYKHIDEVPHDDDRIENDPKFTYASTQNIAGKEPTIPREASLELNQAIAS